MGKEKNTSSQQQTAQYTASPEERALLASQGRIQSAGEGDQISLNKNASSLVNTLLQGQQLPGYLSGAMGINEDQTQSMVNQSLKDLYPQFQTSGVLDSGVAAQIASRTSGNIRNQNAQFNVQSIQQLLNQAIGGQASVQQPMLANAGQYGSSLGGLRSFSGSSQGSTLGMNPFLKSLQTSAGEAIGGNLSGQKWLSASMGGGFK